MVKCARWTARSCGTLCCSMFCCAAVCCAVVCCATRNVDCVGSEVTESCAVFDSALRYWTSAIGERTKSKASKLWTIRRISASSHRRVRILSRKGRFPGSPVAHRIALLAGFWAFAQKHCACDTILLPSLDGQWINLGAACTEVAATSFTSDNAAGSYHYRLTVAGAATVFHRLPFFHSAATPKRWHP